MATEFNKHPLLDLEKLFLDDPLELLKLQQAFEINGWCFVRLSSNPHSFVTQLNHIIQCSSDFFSLRQEEKSRYLTSNAFGYSRVDHKEGIKMLVDQHGTADSQSILPMNIKATLQHVSQLISDLTYRLKPIITQLTVSDQKASEHIEISDLAMLDIVQYFNEKIGPKQLPAVGYNTDEVNCVPHYDPGLFSLSILSTCDGLQLKDQHENKWIDGPDNSQLGQSDIGVIWLGEAASILTSNRFKAGIHRVVYPRTVRQARLTIWQEVCTIRQIDQLLKTDTNAQHLPAGAQVMLANQPDSQPINVLASGESSHNFMKRIESNRGLSISKSMSSDIRILPNSVRANTNISGPPTNTKNFFHF